MEFKLKYKDIDEVKELKENYTIRNLLDDLGLSPQTVVAKQNGDLTIEESVINDGDEIVRHDGSGAHLISEIL